MLPSEQKSESLTNPLNDYLKKEPSVSHQNDDFPLSRGGIFLVAGGVLSVVLAIVTYLFCFVSIEKGHVGVTSWFGQVEDQVLEPGPHLVHPLKRVVRSSVQTQRNEEQAKVPTKSGLAVEVKAVMLYHLDSSKVPAILRDVGPDYEAKVVDPIFRNAARDATAEFEAEALYTDGRAKVEQMVFEKVSKDLMARGFVIEQVMLQDPVLPKAVQDRINAKVAAEQDAVRMQSVAKQRELEAKANARQMELEAEGNLKRKELEAKAKVVEAEGIAKAQTIIKKDLDENYLKYLWVEALKESARHNNATIYIPTGGDGMPLFRAAGPGK